MNLRDFEYVLALAEHKNFSRAAELCNVSQSTLSIQIKKLEEYLGVVLFERQKKTVLLTAAGAGILPHIRQSVESAKTLRLLAKDYQDPLAGDFTLGAFPTLASYLFPLLLPPLQSALPKVKLYLIEEKTHELLARLRAGTLDAAFLALPIDAPDMHVTPCFDDPFMLAVSSSHHLAKRKKVESRELKGESLLLLDEGHCLRDQALSVCQTIGATETASFRATSLETLRQMVKSGLGITLMPHIAITNESGIAYVPLSPIPSRTIGLVSRSGSTRKSILEGIFSVLQRNNFGQNQG